jgi:hypothetical protein
MLWMSNALESINQIDYEFQFQKMIESFIPYLANDKTNTTNKLLNSFKDCLIFCW